MYATKRDKSIAPQVPTGYDEKNPVGKPKSTGSNYGTEDSNLARDPLGTDRMKESVSNEVKSKNNSVLQTLGSLDKIKPNNGKGLLSEDNILS
jgi:hypothetical protein